MRLPDLNAVATFAAVVRTGSLRAAAAERGVTASAVSHALARLERDLGVRLMVRSTRALTLTEAGERLLAAAAPALAEIGAAAAGLDDLRDRPQGRVRLTAPRIAALTILARLLPSFLAAHPGIRLEVSVSDRFEDIAATGFDAGIRLGEALRPNMIAVPIGPPVAMAVVASPGYLAGAPPLDDPADLAAHRCIGLTLRSTGEPYHWEFAKDGRAVAVTLDSQLASDDQELALAAAEAGLGLAYTALDYAQPALEAGRLVRVLEDWTPADERFFLYYQSRKNLPFALKAVIDHLRRTRAGMAAATD